MNTAMNAYQDHFVEHAMQLPGFDSVSVRVSRQEAMQRFMQSGFPTQRLENWKHTSVTALWKRAYKPSEPGCMGLDPDDITPYLADRRGVYRLVFVNGLFSRPLSDLHDLPVGVRVASMAQLVNDSPCEVEPYLGNHTPGNDQGFSDLNHALWGDGAFVHLPSGTRLEKPLHLLYLSTISREPMVAMPRNVVVAGTDAHAQIVESYASLGQARHFTNAHTTLVLGEKARVRHLLLLQESLVAHHVGTMRATQMGDSCLDSQLFSMGGELTRQELHVTLAGERAECSLDGLFIAGGGQHMDFHTSMHHTSPDTWSRQLYKGVLDGNARGVFNGVVRVPPGIHHTRSNQTSANLLLSDTAEIDTKPQLEINTDAVQCSHGATVGSLDPEALFYLQSRGLNVTSARLLLIKGFAEEVLQRVKPTLLQAWVGQSLNLGVKQS
ncbi:MAG: Fe-S cluster assembly protein SufD [Magnetococcales bacterium]|nr:Fe-S cluster assembly protein SufD [Magnetococcales bacterium]